MVINGHFWSFVATAVKLAIPVIPVTSGALELIGKIIESTIKLAIA